MHDAHRNGTTGTTAGGSASSTATSGSQGTDEKKAAWLAVFCRHYGVNPTELDGKILTYINGFAWEDLPLLNSTEENKVFAGFYDPLRANRPRARAILAYLARRNYASPTPPNFFADYRGRPVEEWPADMRFLRELLGTPTKKFEVVQPDHVVLDTPCDSSSTSR